MSTTDNLVQLPFCDFLDRLAARTPSPGGGSVAAATGTLACAMARMVAVYSVGPKTDDQTRARVEALGEELAKADAMLRQLMTVDAQAYEALSQAARAAKVDPTAAARHQSALVAAIGVPMEIGAVAVAALRAMDALRTSASRYLLSDLGVAAVTAEAAIQAAAYNVLVNVREVTDPADRERFGREIAGIQQHGRLLRGGIEQFVRDALKPPA